MIEYDWSQIDNAFYVQDFPLLDETPKEENSPFENPSLTQFSKNFIQVVTSEFPLPLPLARVTRRSWQKGELNRVYLGFLTNRIGCFERVLEVFQTV